MVPSGTSRRRFFNYLAAFLLLALGLIVAIPAFAYLLAPLRRRTKSGEGQPLFAEVGPVADIPIGQWHLLALEVVQQDGWKKTRAQHSLWVRRQREGEQALTVLSPLCPHLGCPVNWYPAEREFKCPCHGGVFDANGRHIAGPPPRSLDPLPFEVRDGKLWVRWEDFRIGIAQRIPVSV